MIRRLRVRQRRLVGASLLLPIGVVASLAARPDFGASMLPLALLDEVSASVWVAAGDVEGEFTVRLGALGGQAALELTPPSDLQRPDVLVYLTRGEPGLDGPPPDGTLLGTLAGERARLFALTPSAGQLTEASALVLYSLAHQERVATVALGGLSDDRSPH